VAERTAPRNRKPPQDKTRRKPGKTVGRNWRSRPLRNPSIRGRTNPEAHVTGSPGLGRTKPGNANREPGGERRCQSNANKKRGKHRNQPQAESRPTGGVSTREGGHSPAPKVGSCYCEPARKVDLGGIGPSKGRPKAPVSQPEHARRSISRGVSPAHQGPAGRSGKGGQDDKIRMRGVLKTASPACERKRNLRAKRQDP
jgi:hypothetical protein